MANREQRALIAQQTLKILDEAGYTTPSGKQVSIAASLQAARTNSIHYRPEDFERVFQQRDNEIRKAGSHVQTSIQVVNATTLSAAKHVVSLDKSRNVLCLNFASAKHPGGGFSGGSQAQEESLARATGLYTCIAQMEEMYNANKHFKSCLYTDNMIYSPNVPVFRNDEDELLDEPYTISILTAPAVNTGAVASHEKHNLSRIEPIMLGRIEKILSLAVLHHHDTLVLGAWGCGVFKNDPVDVANWFHRWLRADTNFKNVFGSIIFAVLDHTSGQTTFNAFASTFDQPS